VAHPASGSIGAEAWQTAHEDLSKAMLAAGLRPDFVEPDFVQAWPFDRALRATGPGASKAECRFDDQTDGLPRLPGRFAWHLDDDYSQLRSARAAAHAAGSSVVRIAHLDTGYDPDHALFPRERIDPHLQRNFVDEDAPNDARDRGMKGVLKNPGHGTGTLGILAGGEFRFLGSGYRFHDVIGAAPDARIVPVRVGNSVVQVSTSSVARALNYVADLCAEAATRVHVLSMSMGGIASEAWAEGVNRAYEAGVVLVTAAGNNFSAGFFGVPTRFIVYPARFRRVIAACGVMADRSPYYGLSPGTMQGNWGPGSKMATAMSAYTPNAPWAEWGCPGVVDMNGAGTSSATPQIAGAAALYVRMHANTLFDRARYPEAWMRAEAVRLALFASVDRNADGGRAEKLGNGLLRASDALAMSPAARSSLSMTPPDSASFTFLRVITGLGAAASASDRMLALEVTQLAQRWSRADSPNPIESAIDDPDLDARSIPPHQIRKFLEAAEAHPEASKVLRKRLGEVLARTPGSGVPPRRGRGPRAPKPRSNGPAPAAARLPRAPAEVRAFVPPRPPFRSLRAFSIDPSLASELDTAAISRTTLNVPWEELAPGPVGEYLEVIDVDPASGCCYEPVDLDHPRLLAQDGLAPSEGTPQFHQQMVYAVCSRTIENFERALGRRALWRPGPSPDARNDHDDSRYVARLRVYPHALREANAYYSPEKVGLLFGYFDPGADGSGGSGGMVFTCLSHDIVAHETTHALLDGMHRRFLVGSNPDTLAFHEAFADIVALFQHFTLPEVLAHQIARTRGGLREHQSLLGALAGQFGRATGLRGALRHGIGRMESGRWVSHEPDPGELAIVIEPHERGAILVGAVFDAFLAIYERRSADLLRLATGGSGVLREGAIHPDLVNRLSSEAARSAQHVLTMCIRALDYCPPTDITFGEYLRAIISADCDMVADDDLNYRVAFIEAFRRRGICPGGVRTLSVESLVWRGPQDEERPPSPALSDILERLRSHAAAHSYATTRAEVFQLQRAMRRQIHEWLVEHFARGRAGKADAAFLGLDPERGFEVHTARFAQRTSPDGASVPQLVVGILQRRFVRVDPFDAREGSMPFEGGCTLVANLNRKETRYCVRKSLSSEGRLRGQRELVSRSRGTSRGVYHGPGEGVGDNEPFAALHRG